MQNPFLDYLIILIIFHFPKCHLTFHQQINFFSAKNPKFFITKLFPSNNNKLDVECLMCSTKTRNYIETHGVFSNAVWYNWQWLLTAKFQFSRWDEKLLSNLPCSHFNFNLTLLWLQCSCSYWEGKQGIGKQSCHQTFIQHIFFRLIAPGLLYANQILKIYNVNINMNNRRTSLTMIKGVFSSVRNQKIMNQQN